MNKEVAFDELIFKLGNCANLYTEKGDLRKNAYRLYYNGEDLGTFTGIPKIAKRTGFSTVVVRGYIDMTSTVFRRAGYIIEEVDMSEYEQAEQRH